MYRCGLWLAPRSLVAVTVDQDGRASPAHPAALDNDARWGLLQYIDAVYGGDCELVLPEELARVDSIAHFALKRGAPVWVAPHRLVEGIRSVAALATGPPSRSAAMIARLALVPVWRGHLRRLAPSPDPRQLWLL